MPVYIQIAVPQRVLDSVRPKGEPSKVAGCVQQFDGEWAVKTLIEPFPSESPPKDFSREAPAYLIEIVFKAHAYQCSQGHHRYLWLVDGEVQEVDCPVCRSAYLSALKLRK
jgi:hypothetical protein